jgi:predicted metal-dependent hydrolase
VDTQSLRGAELAVKSKAAYARLAPKPSAKTKAVVAAPVGASSDSVAAPLAAKETWIEKLKDDIHESKLRLCNWNEEIKRRDRQFGLGDPQVTGSITTVTAVEAAGGPCE